MKSGVGLGGGWSAMRSFGLGLVLLAGLIQAQAASVVNGGSYSVGGNRQGFAGDPVSLSIGESNLLGFEGAQLRFSFDGSVLSFVGASPTDPSSAIFPSVFCDPATPRDCSLFLLTGLGPVNNGHQLFTLNFNIVPTAAPGQTLVVFSNDVTDFSDPALTAGIYDRQLFEGTTIQVLVPEPGSYALMLCGLAALALRPLGGRFRQRRKTGPAAPVVLGG